MYLLSITLISLGILAGCSNNDSTKVQKLETTISSLKKRFFKKEILMKIKKPGIQSRFQTKRKKKKYGLNEDVDLYSNSKKLEKLNLRKFLLINLHFQII